MVKRTLNAKNQSVKGNLLGPCGPTPTNPKRQLSTGKNGSVLICFDSRCHRFLSEYGTCKETKCIPLRVDMNPSAQIFHDTLSIRMILVTHQLVSPTETWPQNQPIHLWNHPHVWAECTILIISTLCKRGPQWFFGPGRARWMVECKFNKKNPNHNFFALNFWSLWQN